MLSVKETFVSKLNKYRNSSDDTERNKHSLTDTTKRIEFLQEKYVQGEISQLRFEKLIDAALRGEPPFLQSWFYERDIVMKKEYRNQTVFMRNGNEYVIKDGLVVPAESDEIDRTIDVTPQRMR
jgi:hypothetical protein